MNKLYNCSLRRKPAKGGRLLVSFHDFTHSGKNYLREIKEFKEARQSASSVGRTTPQPVSETPFLILVQKKISECSELHFISLSLRNAFKTACLT